MATTSPQHPVSPSPLQQCPLSQGAPRVLVVDDDGQILKAIHRSLRKVACEVLTANSGSEAKEILKNQSIAVMLCDEHMPDSQGIDLLCYCLKVQPQAIRILITADRDLDTIAKAINVAQVSQYLAKPWEDTSLRQTVITCLERYQLVQENTRLQKLIFDQHRQLAQNHEHLRYELKLGSRIHEVLLLSRIPHDIPGLTIDALTVPSKEIDGDFYDFYRPMEHIIDVVIGDVMGKGIPAALVGTAVKTQLMRFAVPYNRGQLCSNQEFWRENILEPEEILHRVHQETASQLIDLGYFVSLFYARFNLKNHTMSYVDCGFTKPLHYRSETQRSQPLKGTNFPLGMVDTDYFHTLEVPFQVGDLFVFYSDGVTETKSPDDELYGVNRLTQLIEDNSDASPTQLLRMIRKGVSSFGRKEDFDDDLTVLIIQIDSHLQPRAALDKTATFASDLSQLEAVRQFVQSISLQASGNSKLLSEQLQLAITEAFVNVVKHGYKGKEGEIKLHAELGEEGILMELSDQGDSFNPAEAPEPSLAGDRFCNFGLYIIKQIADVMGYVPKTNQDEWNHLRIYKRYFWESKQMEFTHKDQEDVLVVTLEGNCLDAKEAPHFKDRITDLITSRNRERVVFDLHQLEFIDSSGLGSLLAILRLLNTQNGDLKLACVPSPIKAMFEIVRMHKLFEIFHTTDEAIGSFQ